MEAIAPIEASPWPVAAALRPTGSAFEPVALEVPNDQETRRRLFRTMVLGRSADGQAINLARQGRLAVYASSRGHEAVQVGVPAALEPQDWLFPTYRDAVAAYARGVDIVEILALFRGDWHSGFDPRAHRVAPLTTPIASQTLHATGLAMAATMRGEPVVAVALIGDGGTSEGEFHEAVNFAAVFQAPCVFVVQNNGWAISVPLSRQTRAPSIAHKALAFGIPGIQVDGNDVEAVYSVTKEAVERARGGDGPTLIEAVTRRIEAHTTADDQTRYRSADEIASAHADDPIERHRARLREDGIIDDAFDQALRRDADELVARMREELFAEPDIDPLEMFDHVYADGARLAEQRALLLAELEG